MKLEDMPGDVYKEKERERGGESCYKMSTDDGKA